MSVSPNNNTVVRNNIVRSSFGHKKKKLNFTSKFKSKGMKYFPIKGSLSRKSKIIEIKGRSSRNKTSSGSINKNNGKDLERINSILHKLQEVTKVKNSLAVSNQTMKFRLAELQKEKYSLTLLNK